MVRLGAHESVSGGLHLAFDRIRQVGGEVLQIFTRNQRQWAAPALTAEEIALFRVAHRQNPNVIVAAHASYLVNLASGKEDLKEKSVHNLVLELGRCAELGIPYVVLHPGSHGGDGIEAGLKRFVGGLDLVLGESRGQVQVLVETTAGQGTGLGSRFEELAYILENSRYPHLLGVCVDTCHIFAAGYDIRSLVDYEVTIAALEKTVGLAKVRFFHLNDSKNELGSRVDRHEHIGNGCIGLGGFSNLLRDCRFADLPMILETPKGESLEEDRENLQTLRSLL
ncbi:MAG: deoxyribonuclease IV [Proteobacteria bacterium]|nr:deoxyribonuclease IV [Pseudomonadota bacterium]